MLVYKTSGRETLTSLINVVIGINTMAKSISFGGKSFKISRDKVATVPGKLNGVAQGGVNKHPWANPIETLFGSWEESQDLPDFFKDTSKKKSLHQRALTVGQLLDVIQDSWDPVSQKVKVGDWKSILGWDEEPEGSAFSCQELEDIAYATRKHYALVSVASGFDWSARGINMYPLMKDLGMLELLPDGCADVWHTTVLLCLWCVYEAFGLGGLNYTALDWHGWMRSYGRSGKVSEHMLTEDQLMEYNTYASPSEFLRKYWKELLSSEGILQELIDSDAIWQNILFLIVGREIVAKKVKGDPYSQFQKNYSFGELSLEDVEFLVLSAAAQRAASKGRLSINEGDDYQEPTGIVKALLNEGYEDYWDVLRDVEYPSVGTQMLLDVFAIVEDWSTIRSSIIGADEMNWQ